MVRPMIRMSQIAASVESRGMNLMHSLFFLNATSSEGKNEKRHESSRDADISIPSTRLLSRTLPVSGSDRSPEWPDRRAGFYPSCPPQGRSGQTGGDCRVGVSHPALRSRPDPRQPLPRRGAQGYVHFCKERQLGINRGAGF